ncbi:MULTISPECIES: mechanosensitive ion channel family protein [Pseudoalteromonas]|uniref:Small-conductance mechanosensitive channel n=1 Tax=Pseudoalteromonas maricaloris TaxID=184924 RepID=A0A8I2HBA5_9GAMM|nr:MULTISPECIES: mechanosensitive ion channel domain-containing protein [Pseudoalteromonas]NLR23536.1 mechanosensitive ion channel [Pseudoalteromonas maricaloris]QZO13583.1 mechanosensitive ion channel [Pseudoalteromonas piscicida]WOX29344.1 mechanosensitive ion channel [Pseudoalteromonas maricaloris]
MGNITAFLSEHQAQLLSIGQNTLLTILILVAAAIGAKVLKRAVYKAVYRVSKQDEIVTKLLSTLSGYVVYLIAVVIILDLFGVNTASLVALVGAAGLAIGLALKDTLSNVAAGVMLLFLKPLRKSEFVEVSGSSGSVKDLGLFTTVLETADGIYISIPNSTVWAGAVKNFSRNDKRRMDITVGISYGDSIEDGLTALRELVAEEPRILNTPEPQYLVHTLADSSVNLQLRAWTPTANYWDIYWKTQRKVKDKVESMGITIPFPQRDLHIIEGDKQLLKK